MLVGIDETLKINTRGSMKVAMSWEQNFVPPKSLDGI